MGEQLKNLEPLENPEKQEHSGNAVPGLYVSTEILRGVASGLFKSEEISTIVKEALFAIPKASDGKSAFSLATSYMERINDSATAEGMSAMNYLSSGPKTDRKPGMQLSLLTDLGSEPSKEEVQSSFALLSKLLDISRRHEKDNPKSTSMIMETADSINQVFQRHRREK